MRAQIALFDGFDLLDAMAPYEVFLCGAMVSDGRLAVEFASAEGAREVPCGLSGLRVPTSAVLDPEGADMIVVPGAAGRVSGDGPDTIPAILGRALETELPAALERAMVEPGVLVAAVCGGSLLLAMRGLLEGRPAVTHHLGMDLLEATGAVPVEARVVDDGNLVTAGGVTSGLDLALYLLERELGPQVAHSVEKLFEYERRGTVWRAAGLEPVAP